MATQLPAQTAQTAQTVQTQTQTQTQTAQPVVIDEPKHVFQIGDVLEGHKSKRLYVVTGVRADGVPNVVNIKEKRTSAMFTKPRTTSEITQSYTTFSGEQFLARQKLFARKSALINVMLSHSNCDLIFRNKADPEQKIYTMRAIMADGCTYFKERFNGRWDEPNMEIDIPAEDFEYVRRIVNYLHCVLEIPCEKIAYVHEMLRVCDYYGCLEFIEIIINALPGKLTVEAIHYYTRFLDNPLIAPPIFDFIQNHWFEIEEKNPEAFEVISARQNTDLISHILGKQKAQEDINPVPQKKQKT